MDAAARAELEALRRRAFSPDADIHDDPPALARLLELEDLARPQVAAEPTGLTDAVVPEPGRLRAPAPAEALVAAADPPMPTLPDDRAPASSALRAWMRRGPLTAGILAAAAIIVTVVLAQPQRAPLPAPAATPSPAVVEPDYALIADPESEALLRIRIDGAFGGYIQLPSGSSPTAFSSEAALDWTVHLGEYYGWDLWIAGDTAGEIAGDQAEHCLLIQRGDDVRVKCGGIGAQGEGLLWLSVAGADIAPEELPAPMAEGDRIRFWWLPSGAIEVVLGSFEDG